MDNKHNSLNLAAKISEHIFAPNEGYYLYRIKDVAISTCCICCKQIITKINYLNHNFTNRNNSSKYTIDGKTTTKRWTEQWIERRKHHALKETARLVKKLKDSTCITDYSQHGSHSQNNSNSSDFILNSLRNSMNPLH